MIDRKRLVERFIRYVIINSETKNEKEFYELIINELESLGLDVVTDYAGSKIGSNANNIYCYIEGNSENKNSTIYSAHLDTVKPGKNIKPIIDGEYIKSSGNTILGGDDKAGVAAIMEAINIIKDNNIKHNPIEIIFTISEEGGLNGSKNLDYSLIRSNEAFIFDSGGEVGVIINQAPSQYKLDIEVLGEASHAGGAPEKGISAINVAAEAISNMNLLRIDEETTANIGSFIAEGETNIVNPKALIEAEVRSLSKKKLEKEMNNIIKQFEDTANKHGANVKINKRHLYSGYKINSNDKLLLKIENTMKALKVKPKRQKSGGGSDANIFNEKGIKSINLGIGGENAHTLKEKININELEKISEIALNLMIK